MSTHFFGEGNIGTAPEYREFPNDNDEPSRLLRLNVYFDNPVPKKDGTFEDRGGFWAPVELWHRDAERWASLYQKGRTPRKTNASPSRSRRGAWAFCRFG